MKKSSTEIAKLINRMESLHDGDRAVDLLVACGVEAISPLRDYLMEGQPSHIFQPRQRAVTALAELDAQEVLIEYLRTPKNIPDPVTRFGEEAVENTAARLLARWQTEDTFDFLKQISYTRTLPGVIEALASFRRAEAIPFFIAALTDDLSRPAAEKALRSMAEAAKPALIELVGAFPEDPENNGNPSMQIRRRSVMQILMYASVNKKDWPMLKELIRDPDQEISIPAALMALDIADMKNKKSLINMLITKIPHATSFNTMEIKKALLKNYFVAERDLEKQIEQRSLQPVKKQANDSVLRILLSVRKMVESGDINE